MSKKISILIPCYNEQKSVEEMYMRLRAVLDNDLKQYDYEIIYVDDYSTDNTRNEIKKICEKDKMVKAVFNAKNFGFHRNVFEAFKYASGDRIHRKCYLNLLINGNRGINVLLDRRIHQKKAG